MIKITNLLLKGSSMRNLVGRRLQGLRFLQKSKNLPKGVNRMFSVSPQHGSHQDRGFDEPETLTPDLAKLYTLDGYAEAVEHLIDKNYPRAEQELSNCLNRVFERGLDTPAVLINVYSRIAITQIFGEAEIDRVEETLKELFLINLSSNQKDPESLYKSVLNLIVFYLKNDSVKGFNFLEYLEGIRGDLSLPQVFHNEITMVGGILYQVNGRLDEALTRYEELLSEDNRGGLLSPGMVLNNYAVCLMNLQREIQDKEDHKERIEKIEKVFEDSILNFEGLISSANDDSTADEIGLEIEVRDPNQPTLEDEGNVRKVLFTPRDNKNQPQDPEGGSIKHEDYSLLTNVNSILPLINLAEVNYMSKNLPKLIHLSMICLSCSRNFNSTASALRMFSLVSDSYSGVGEADKAIDIIEQAIYLLTRYKVNSYVRARVLGSYVGLLEKQDRFFEANEMTQALLREKVESRSIDEEMLFIPDYVV